MSCDACCVHLSAKSVCFLVYLSTRNFLYNYVVYKAYQHYLQSLFQKRKKKKKIGGLSRSEKLRGCSLCLLPTSWPPPPPPPAVITWAKRAPGSRYFVSTEMFMEGLTAELPLSNRLVGRGGGGGGCANEGDGGGGCCGVD